MDERNCEHVGIDPAVVLVVLYEASMGFCLALVEQLEQEKAALFDAWVWPDYPRTLTSAD